MTSSKGKEKSSEEKETVYVDMYQDAQEQNDPTWEKDYLSWLTSSWERPQDTLSKLTSSWERQRTPPDSEFASDYDSDRSLTGPW